MDEQATTQVYKLKDYTVVFTFYDKFTFVSVWSDNPTRGPKQCFAGASRCNPRDEYNRDTGMLVALRRACGIEHGWNPLPEVFSAYRKARWEESHHA